ncbi:MAG: DUF4349 domain-containing protein [bacterium]
MDEKKGMKLSTGTIILLVVFVGIFLAMLLPRASKMTKSSRPALEKHIESIREEDKSISGYNLPQQKIIKTEEIELEVKDFREAIRKIRRIAEDMGGFVTDSEEYIGEGDYRSGSIVLRIPQDRFNKVITMIEEIGKVKHSQTKGKDVTKEYIDFQARLANQEAVKKRFLEILKEETKKFDDIIKVEQELKRIGEEIERLQGEIKYLEDQVGLSTIRVNISEPKTIVSSAFNTKEIFKNAIHEGTKNCIHLIAGLILFTITLLPLIVFAILILIVRDYWKKRKEKIEKIKEVQNEQN